jgi:hypothetical protein
VIHVTAVLLDLANIVGGFLLAAALLADLPRVGRSIARVAAVTARAKAVIGVLALVMGGYYLILHLTAGLRVFHFELVGIGIGVATLRDRLFPRHGAKHSTGPGAVTGGGLLLAVFGLIAVVVGFQGLLTADS